MQEQAETTTEAAVPNGTPDHEQVYQTDTPNEADESSSDETEPDAEDTFPRSYVEELRQENGRHRQRAREAEQRLHVELVRATGRLADPTDLPYADDHLDDPEALTAAIETLLTAKPHLAARKPVGDIGQGATKSATNVDLMAVLRGSR